MLAFYLTMAALTLVWFVWNVPPRTAVELAVTAAAVVLWPAFYAYAIFTVFRRAA